MATEFTGIVLAGGRSSRMGRDKALLPWAGATLLDRMTGLLREAGAARVVVSGDRPGHDGIADAWPGRGPLAGIASVLHACPDGPAVVVPVDLPLLSRARLEPLARALQQHRAAFYEGHPLPCAFVVDADSRALATRLVEAAPTGPSVRQWLEAAGAASLDAGREGDLQPCNTPEDFARVTP